MVAHEKLGPSLPAELTDRVIYHLRGERTSLLQCGLVCRLWLPASRFHSFAGQWLDPSDTTVLASDSDKLWQLLDPDREDIITTPFATLPQYMTHLVFKPPQYGKSYFDCSAGGSFEDAFANQTHTPIFNDTSLHRLSAFTAVTNVTMRYMEADDLDHLTCARLGRILSGIQVLAMSHCIFRDTEAFTTFLGGMLSLQSLDVFACGFKGQDDVIYHGDSFMEDEESGGFCSLSPQLRVLRLDCSGPALHLARWAGACDLHTVDFHIFVWRSARHLNGLLRGIGSSLKTLTVSVSDYYIPDEFLEDGVDLGSNDRLEHLTMTGIALDSRQSNGQSGSFPVAATFLLSTLRQVISVRLKLVSFGFLLGDEGHSSPAWEVVLDELSQPRFDSVEIINFKVEAVHESPEDEAQTLDTVQRHVESFSRRDRLTIDVAGEAAYYLDDMDSVTSSVEMLNESEEDEFLAAHEGDSMF